MKNTLLLLLIIWSQIVTAQRTTGKISIHTELSYELNTPSLGDKPEGFQSYFDGKLEEYKDVNWDAIFKDKFERRYEFPDIEDVIITQIKAYSFEGGTLTNPTRFYIIPKGSWQKVLVAEFYGNAYKQWQTFDFPAINVKYLIIQNGDVKPTELEFYGSYNQGYVKAQPSLNVPSVPFKEMVGINMFSWNIVQNWGGSYDPSKWAEIGFIHSFRHYIGWNTIEPTRGVYDFTGNWNLDAVYNKLEAEGKTILICIKGLPDYLQSTYPNGGDPELNPAPYGSDLSDTLSYLDSYRLWKTVAARYKGRKVWYEIENERNKWWKGRNGYQTAREYAAYLYMCAKGILEADPNAKISIGGIADNNTDYFRGIIDWYKEYKGALNFHALNYHVYASDANQQYASSKGVSPEQARVYDNHLPHLLLAQQYSLKCFIGEIGYDHSPYSTQGPPEINGFTIEQTVGNWNLRSMLMLSRAKLDGLQFYMWDNVVEDLLNGGVYNTSGWHSGGGASFQYRKTSLYAMQILKLLGNYRYESTLQHSPEIDVYDSAGIKRYVAWMPTSNNSKGSFTNGKILKPYSISETGKIDTLLNASTLEITEHPILFDIIEGSSPLPIKEKPGKGNGRPTKPKFTVYPNPTTDMVAWDKPRKYKLINQSGIILQQGTAKQISLKKYPQGIYAIIITDDNGYEHTFKQSILK
jgi:endoglucanase